jgi:hypothetical protein
LLALGPLAPQLQEERQAQDLSGAGRQVFIVADERTHGPLGQWLQCEAGVPIPIGLRARVEPVGDHDNETSVISAGGMQRGQDACLGGLQGSLA